MRATIATLLLAATIGVLHQPPSAQTPSVQTPSAQAPAAQPPAAQVPTPSAPGGRPSAGTAATASAPAGGQADAPPFTRAPDALARVTWRTRTLVGDERLTHWKLAIPTQSLGGLTFLDAIVRADAAVVSFVEAASTQQVGGDIAKPLDARLTAAEIATIRRHLGPVRLLAYRVDALAIDAAARRAQLQFARALGAEMIVVPAATTLDGLDALADEFTINVAILADSARPTRLLKALDGHSRRLGIAVDTGRWLEEGLSTREGLAIVKDRLSYVLLRDRSARGAGTDARNVRLGEGVGEMTTFFHELNRLKLRPLALTLDTTGVVRAPADLFPALDAFEAVVQPAYGTYFTELSRSAPIRRDLARPRRGETLTPEEIGRRSDEARRTIEAAIPRQPYATPKKPRKLLVIDACLAGMSHDTIPHANVMLESMGRITGAWATELNNDLNNLKYPKIKQYDAVYLNDNVGELLPDPAVRDGLARFVREGGGLGGVHGTPWASRNWDELGVMIGAKSAPHRIEQGVMRVYDPASPIVQSFGGTPLPFREEYYRFEHAGPNRLRWEEVRVLLTVDLDDPAVEPRPWTGYKRPDNTYPVTWIRQYGQGRTFYSSLGHIPETFMTPAIVGHFLAGVQFLLGDLDAPTTPNPRSATTASATPAAAGAAGAAGVAGAATVSAASSSQAPGAPRASAPAAPAGSSGNAPAVVSISQRPNGSSLGTIRVGAADNTFWFGWRVGVPATAIKDLTFSDALAKVDVLSVTSVEASSTQTVSPDVPKPLDHRLQPGERNAVVHRLRELNQRVLAYRVDDLAADLETRRKVLGFAKAIDAPIVIIAADTPRLDELDALAEAVGLSVALESRSEKSAPASVVRAIQGRSPRIGIAADLDGWMQAGISPADGLSIVKERLLLVRVADRAPLGPKGRAVSPGDGAGGLGAFFLAAFRAGVTPLSITVAPTGRSAATEADLLKDLTAFERIMWPAMAERVRQVVDSPAGRIRGPDRLDADMRQQIDAAAPRQPIVKPARPRKLLITDLQMYSGHATIPHANWLLELMATYTGAFEPTFSNDLNLLKYPAIKAFDAVFLNNVCGMVHNDPEVREGLLRFVREGGGLGGNHAVTYANNHWPEFAALMGGWAGAHHLETQVIKIDDPKSPLTRSFGSASFEHTDEFYVFPPSSPYSREKQHILLSIDVERSDRATTNRFCAACARPDQDYGLAWIGTYGKGRTYFTPLGHTTIMYTDRRWTQHLLAAVQYMLGDLEADATPSAKLAAPKGSR